MKNLFLVGMIIAIVGVFSLVEAHDPPRIQNRLNHDYFENYHKPVLSLDPVVIRSNRNEPFIVTINLKNVRRHKELFGFIIKLRIDKQFISFLDLGPQTQFEIRNKERVRVDWGNSGHNEVTVQFNKWMDDNRALVQRNEDLVKLKFRWTGGQANNLQKIEFKDVELIYSNQHLHLNPTYNDLFEREWNEYEWGRQEHHNIVAFNSWVTEGYKSGDLNFDGRRNQLDRNIFYREYGRVDSKIKGYTEHSGEYLRVKTPYKNKDNIHVWRLIDLARKSRYEIGIADITRFEEILSNNIRKYRIAPGAPGLYSDLPIKKVIWSDLKRR